MPGGEPLEEHEVVFDLIKRKSGIAEVASTIPFAIFVEAFEMQFLDGAPMHKACIRGLRCVIDVNGTKEITKPAFAKFWKGWKASGLGAEAYLRKLADDAPPTMFQQGAAGKAAAAEAAATAKTAAASAAADTAAAAKEKLNSMTGGMRLGGMMGKKK